ncbi:MAG: ArsC/Spx/MgsR family protein [Bacteroidota bacterium]
MIIIYHNPQCSKSRNALNAIVQSEIKFQVVEYLSNLFSEETLRELIKKLNSKPEELVRKNENIYKQKFKGKNYSDDEWIKIMVENPKLIQRPIVLIEPRAFIVRDEQTICKILNNEK